MRRATRFRERAEDRSLSSDPLGTKSTRPRHLGRDSAALRLIRPAQWSKNVLVFGPALLVGQVPSADHLRALAMTFASFCLVASAGYIANDLADREHDAVHTMKRDRPIPAGDITVTRALWLGAVLLLVGFGLAAATGSAAILAVIICYFVLSLSYSLWLKRLAWIDVAILAIGYCLRTIAGGPAAGVPVTGWLVGTCILLFLSLGLAKRHAELSNSERDPSESLPGRGYRIADRSRVAIVGRLCGAASFVLLACWAALSETATRAEIPLLLVLVGVIYAIWIHRIWSKASTRQLTEDPVIFAVTDPASVVSGLAVIVLLVAAGLEVT